MGIEFRNSHANILLRLREAFARGRAPRIMLAPPAISQSPNPIAGTLKTSSASDFGATGKHRYVAGKPYQLEFPGTDWVKFTTVSYSADGSAFEQIGGSVEFCTNAPIFEINMGGNGTPVRLWCEEDGELRLVSTALLRTSATNGHFIVDFSAVSAVPTARRLRVDFGSGGAASFFSGVTTSVLYDVWRPLAANPLRCIVAGDSFTEGTTADGAQGDTMGLSGFVNHMGWHLGLDDVWSSGSGGTGWLQTSGSRIALASRLQRDVIDYAPDMAVIAMGVNDGSQDPIAVQAVVAAAVASFRQQLPNSPLIGVLPWAPQGAGVAAINDAIRAGYETDVSGRTHVVDPTVPGAEWQWPASGHQGNPTNVGNGDWLVDNGGTHSTVAGYAYQGYRLAEVIKARLAA